MPAAVLDDIVSWHAINPKRLRAADFEAFFDDRAEALLGLVEWPWVTERSVRTRPRPGTRSRRYRSTWKMKSRMRTTRGHERVKMSSGPRPLRASAPSPNASL